MPDDRWIVHADAHCIVVNKPSGLPSVPGRAAHVQDCAASRVQALWPDARVVHRLDMDTSGLLLFARGLGVQRELSALFEKRRIQKGYTALVSGTPNPASGQMDWPLSANWPQRPRQQVDLMHGKAALTHYEVVDEAPGFPVTVSRLRLRPVTGRSHQIRVHLQALGHPILGDPLYAPPEVRALSPRLCLHACRLELTHPGTGVSWVLESPDPF